MIKHLFSPKFISCDPETTIIIPSPLPTTTTTTRHLQAHTKNKNKCLLFSELYVTYHHTSWLPCPALAIAPSAVSFASTPRCTGQCSWYIHTYRDNTEKTQANVGCVLRTSDACYGEGREMGWGGGEAQWHQNQPHTESTKEQHHKRNLQSESVRTNPWYPYHIFTQEKISRKTKSKLHRGRVFSAHL